MNDRIYPKRIFEKSLRELSHKRSVIKKVKNREVIIDKILENGSNK